MISASELWQRLAPLDLTIEGASFDRHTFPGSFERVTTEVHLHGDGMRGSGEDVSYVPAAHDQVTERVQALQLAGNWTLQSLSSHLEAAFSGTASGDDKSAYGRWAVEAAAVDLALRQHSMTLATLMDVDWQPMTFCLSMGLGSPASVQPVQRWLDAEPTTTFKLDTSSSWNEQIVQDLTATGAVRVVDFKGLYTGEWADNTADPDLYRMVATMPDALLEDAKLDPQTIAALGPSGMGRLSWDFPIVDVDSVTSLTYRPAAINIKPSRFGSMRGLLETIDHCQRAQIPLYAGGQFELGIGRTQVQHIASLFFAAAPNDIAPVAFHSATPESPPAASPLRLPPVAAGFGFAVDD